ncbi:MAG: hypothetical protein SWK90_11425 [Chloroflexota bacterium]|nr:hypothetical protein [Chloroflexota bacterium]
MSENDRLSTNQRKALKALLECSTIRAAAESCGLGEATLYRYLRDDTFKAELRKRQDGIVSSVTAALVGLAGESVKTLRDILDSKTASDSVKVRAALGWLAQMRQSVELADLAARVEALEQASMGGK